MRWVSFLVAAVILSSNVFGGQTAVSVQITGLPALSANFGPVRFADLPKLMKQLPTPQQQRYLLASGKTWAASPSSGHPLPTQPPTYQEGNLVACF